MKLPALASVRQAVLFGIGVGIIIYNTVWGAHDVPTFVVGLTLCGLVPALSLDSVIRKIPAPTKETTP